MTTIIKTYSRARTAVAALRKVLDMYEVPATFYAISTNEVETGRFAASVNIDGRQLAIETIELLEADLLEAGFEFDLVRPEVDTHEAPEGLIEAQDKVQKVAGGLVITLVAKKSGYVKETSTIQNATKRVWAIADSMPGAARKDVIEACRAEGIAYGTARTQYQHWKTASKG